MNTQFIRSLLVALMVLMGVGGSMDGQSISYAETGMGTISGRVTAPDGVTSLADVNIFSYQIDEDSTRLWRSTKTDGDGMYELVTEAGMYYLDFIDPHGRYASRYYKDAVLRSNATPVTVTEGEVVSGIDVSLGIGAHITGRVTEPDGITPLVGIWVRTNLISVPGLATGGTDLTDSNGEYNAPEDFAGTYIIRFYDVNGPYLSEFYDDAPTEYRATRIELALGETVSGIDASLALGGAIRGVIRDATGAPISPTAAILWQQIDGQWQKYGQSTTNVYGLYRFGGLYPGVYRLAIHYRSWEPTIWYDGADSLETATDIVLEPGTIFDQDIVLPPAAPTPAPPEIPEPATILLLGAGLVGLAASARARRT